MPASGAFDPRASTGTLNSALARTPLACVAGPRLAPSQEMPVGTARAGTGSRRRAPVLPPDGSRVPGGGRRSAAAGGGAPWRRRRSAIRRLAEAPSDAAIGHMATLG